MRRRARAAWPRKARAGGSVAGRRGALAAGAAALALVGACSENGEPAERAPAASSERAPEGGPGRILYVTYCQGCHGPAGRGDGPGAWALREPPPDLTELWKRYGTPLDRERLAAIIDGRWLVEVHGPREMPVWGREFFEDAAPTMPNVEGSRRQLVEVLVDYLETLQTEREL